MAIPEAQLEIWSHQGSIAQSRDTYATVKKALEAMDTKYANKDFEVFLQGSYANDTNIYAESDIDVVIRLDSVYYHDTSALTSAELTAFNSGFSAATYLYADYKAHVSAALQKSFGATAVKPGTKALKVPSSGNRRSADVIVACEFRRYYSAPLIFPILGPQYHRGICFFTSAGSRVVNYPKQHTANCTAKHQTTDGWFKPMVRIFKNMRTRLLANGAIKPGRAPSYFLEGLLYNVPSDRFGRSYRDSFMAAMNWIIHADRSMFLCPNEQYYLVRNGVPECWPCAHCDAFINAAVDLWNHWS